MKIKISVVFGTRPEAIKLAPVINEIKKHSNLFEIQVLITAQHRQMLDQVLKVFDIIPDIDLNLMEPNQSLTQLTSNSLNKLDKCFKEFKPEMILVQGDTTTVMAASLAAFYNKIKIGHIEAGLRTNDKYSPFPEEINRIVTSHIADIHFAPTKLAFNNLIKEGIPEKNIHITGNTVIDALFMGLEKVKNNKVVVDGISNNILEMDYVLITGHRRENFGDGFKNICSAISQLAEDLPKVQFIYPVHLNPNVKNIVYEKLSDKKNIHLLKPLDYLPFIHLMSKAKLIITDSGGVQEEAPSLNIPVLVMRDTTERPEGLHNHLIKLVGTNKDLIIESVKNIFEKPFRKNLLEESPYGDGTASTKIVQYLKQFFNR